MSITSTGIGSGLDVNTLVSQLVTAERSPTAARIDAFEKKTKAEISAFGTLRSTLDGLRTAIGKLRLPETVQARKASVPEGAHFSVTTTSDAAIGRYDVEVLALSSAHKLASTPFATQQTPVGTGKLTIASGDTTIAVDIDATHNTLDGVRDAINKAAGGKGVVATIVQADDGAHLVLSATQTGAANALHITASGGDGGLAVFANASAPNTMQQLEAATDARIKVDGFERSSPTNTIADLVEGVSFTLTKAEPGTTQTLTVAADSSVLRTAAKAFVSSYNSATTALKSVSRYDAATKVAAPLNGDPLVRGVSRDLRAQVGEQVEDLKALGITVGADGLLKMDDAAFDAAMAKDAAPAARLFTGDDSLSAHLDQSLDRLLDDDGLLHDRDQGLSARTKSIAKQRDDLDTRMTQVEARYRAQFVALDGLMTQMQSISSYLTQQLSNL